MINRTLCTALTGCHLPRSPIWQLICQADAHAGVCSGRQHETAKATKIDDLPHSVALKPDTFTRSVHTLRSASSCCV